MGKSSVKGSATTGEFSLGGTRRDVAVTVAKIFANAVPFGGGVIAEIIGAVIPEQRIERIERFLQNLAEQIETFQYEVSAESLSEPESVDLFEEGALQASRALSEERIRYISNLVAHGMTGDSKDRTEAKRLLNLIRSLDDDQIIILASYLHENQGNEEFRTTHAAVLEPSSAHMGSSRDEIDQSIVTALAREEMKRLGLLRGSFKKPKKGEIPEFDEKTGMMKASSVQLTPLGRLLLTRLRLHRPTDE